MAPEVSMMARRRISSTVRKKKPMGIVETGSHSGMTNSF
jgi:hypothetical protein